MHSPYAERGSTFWICAVVVIAVLYPLQAGRSWQSRIFPPPQHLNVDAPEWLKIAEQKPFLAHTIEMRVTRPVYPLPAYLIKQVLAPDVATLLIYRIINLGWLFLALAGLRYCTLRWTQSGAAALVAGLLFCLSPCVQIYLSQPEPTIAGNAAAICALALAISAAAGRPANRFGSAGLWIGCGALCAVLMMAKEVYAVYLALLLIGAAQRAWKQIAWFAAGALTLHAAYIAWVLWGLERPYGYGDNHHGFLTWIVSDFGHRGLTGQLTFLLRLAARIAVRTLQAFELWPVLLAITGYALSPVKPRRLHLTAYAAAFYVMFFAMNVVTPRICFLLFPLVYPMAGYAAVHVAAKLHGLARAAWITLILTLALAGATIDPFRFFYYG